MGVFLLDDIDAFWNFEEASGTLVDSVNGLVATPVGVVINYEQTGVNNNCIRLNFGGGSTYLTIPSTPTLLYGDEDMTLSVFVNLIDESLGSGQVFGCWYGADPTAKRSYNLFYSQTPNTYQFNVSPDGTQASQAFVQSSVTPISFSTWYHILCQHDSVNNTIEIRVTPRSDSTIASADSQAHSAGIWDGNDQAFLIGRHDPAGPAYIKGLIENLGLWRRKLNGDEIEALFDEEPFANFVSGQGVARNFPTRYFQHFNRFRRRAVR